MYFLILTISQFTLSVLETTKYLLNFKDGSISSLAHHPKKKGRKDKHTLKPNLSLNFFFLLTKNYVKKHKMQDLFIEIHCFVLGFFRFLNVCIYIYI